MHISKNELYEKIKDLKTKEEFEEEIKKIIQEYDNLLDEDTAALLLVDKLGRNDSITKISDLEPGMECTITGTVTEIGEIREFNKKNGGTGFVTNLVLKDDAGTCKLALWHGDVGLVKDGKIKNGTELKIVNGYVKKGYYGIEINVGRWGLLEITSNGKKEKIFEKENKVSGTLIETKPSKAFFKDNGEFGFVTDIKVETQKGPKQITLWDDKVKDIQNYKKGEKIQLENLVTKDRNGKKETHLNRNGKIKKL